MNVEIISPPPPVTRVQLDLSVIEAERLVVALKMKANYAVDPQSKALYNEMAEALDKELLKLYGR